MHTPPHLSRRSFFLRCALIGLVLLLVLLAVGYVGAWLTPHRLTAQRLVDQLQTNAGGTFPGFRRNHAKGVCVAGYFDSNGHAQTYSVAQVFGPGHTPVVGRFSIPGGNHYAADNSNPGRSLALRFTQPNGQQWRSAINNTPVFPVATPQAFYEFIKAMQPDASTGKPNPATLEAFFATHPETAAFRVWAKTVKPSASYVTQSYWSLNAFILVDAHGEKRAMRWRLEPEANDKASGGSDADYLTADLTKRFAQAPQRWHLIVTLAAPGDPTDDATKAWPPDRSEIDAGTLVLTRVEPQEHGACRDINYDPTVLPYGIELSDDPLLPARSAAYANSYLRRTSELARLSGAATTKPQAKL